MQLNVFLELPAGSSLHRHMAARILSIITQRQDFHCPLIKLAHIAQQASGEPLGGFNSDQRPKRKAQR